MNPCRKSEGESVLASFPRSDYTSNSTNISWLARTGHITGVALLHVCGVVRWPNSHPLRGSRFMYLKCAPPGAGLTSKKGLSKLFLPSMLIGMRLNYLHILTRCLGAVWDSLSSLLLYQITTDPSCRPTVQLLPSLLFGLWAPSCGTGIGFGANSIWDPIPFEGCTSES
jgi:hypothetical protein